MKSDRLILPLLFFSHSHFFMQVAKRLKLMSDSAASDRSSLYSLESFVPGSVDSPFPIQNLPYGVFRLSKDSERRLGVAIGQLVFDLNKAAKAGLFDDNSSVSSAFQCSELNSFMALGVAAWRWARRRLQSLLSKENPQIRDDQKMRENLFHQQSAVFMELPAAIGDYTDFYSSRYHAYNVGVMFRGPANALQPNWSWLPVGYHGRSSSVVVDGTPVHRPRGQVQPDESKDPLFGDCKLLDFELEMAAFVGPGNSLGQPITMKDAGNHLFGLVLMNDWSARDLQKWEYVPLGPFTAKNFATSIAPWVVTMEALEPFRLENPVQDPPPMDYLTPVAGSSNSTFDIGLTVALQTEDMKEPQIISKSNAKYLYWTFEQQLVHHTVSGCNMRPGDLLGTGTISGPEPTEYGSLLEITWRGSKEIKLNDGSVRKFLQNGDSLTIAGVAERADIPFKIGFGSVTGKILPPVERK